MKTVETAIGILFLLSMFAALVVTYHRHMQSIWADIAAEDANRMAEQKFREMKRNMKIRVIQRLTIKDEMGCRNEK